MAEIISDWTTILKQLNSVPKGPEANRLAIFEMNI